jgi:hypothetical protein
MNSNLFWKFHATLFGCVGASLLVVWLLGFELSPALLAAIIGTSALAAFTRQPD